MRVLLDHNLPKQLRGLLTGHLAFTARQACLDNVENGELLAAAESRGFEVLLTGDKDMYDQQNHTNRRLSLVVLGNPLLRNISPHLEAVIAAISKATPGSYEQVPIPLPPKRKWTRRV